MDAIIDHTDDRGEQYSLYIRGKGGAAWFDDSDLELIGHHREDLKEKWEKELEERDRQTSDLDWIFSQDSLEDLAGSSYLVLYRLLGGHNPCGSNGEGWNCFWNTLLVAKFVEPFLKKHDKEGFLGFAEEFKKVRQAALEYEKTKRKENENENEI